MKTAQQIIEDTDNECENANYHDRIGIAGDLFDSIKNIVDEKNHLILARAIYDNVTLGI